MLKLTKDEIAFLRWLWTNGGQASLSGKIKPGSTDRMTSAGYMIVLQKSKVAGYEFVAKIRSRKQSPICTTSVVLPKSPVSLAWGDEVPHILTRKSCLQAAEFLITSAKRLLQHYLYCSGRRCRPPRYYALCPYRARTRSIRGIGEIRGAVAVLRGAGMLEFGMANPIDCSPLSPLSNTGWRSSSTWDRH